MPNIRRTDTTWTVMLETDAGTVPVTVTRKRVKNINLRIDRDGTVKLSIPTRLPARQLEEFLARRGPWIAERVARHRARTAAEAGGAKAGTVPLWGELVDEQDARARCGVPDGLDRAAALEALYRAELAERLPGCAKRAEADMGIAAASWQVRVMTSRWGSCTPARRTIRINAMLAAYPPACLDFVVRHELCHLMEPSHNARFHMLLDSYCPDNRTLARLLRRSAREVAAGTQH